jgi:hypothetical protein
MLRFKAGIEMQGASRCVWIAAMGALPLSCSLVTNLDGTTGGSDWLASAGNGGGDAATRVDGSDSGRVDASADVRDASHDPTSEACTGRLCAGNCVDTQIDPANCADCGRVCTAPANATATCSAGVCGFSCTGGTDNCSGSCVDVNSSPSHCGSCSIVCPTSQVCSGGSCVSQCGSGLFNCSGSCVNRQTDPSNCGTCDTVCTAPTHGSPTCASGNCGFSCNTDFTKCGARCLDTSADILNCGACNNSCSAPDNSIPTCADGECGFECDGSLTECSGQCVDSQNDPAHCNQCEHQCPAAANASASCSGGQCGIHCDPNYTECSSGCVDTETDPNNCATCGNICASGSCAAGVCGPNTKLIFASSQLYTGNLGGLTGADAKCQALASAVGRTGTFLAWLSDNTNSAANRFAKASVPYVLIDGSVVANDWADLTDSTLQHAINKTELNTTPPSGNMVGCDQPAVWTDTLSSGALASSLDCCDNWGSTSGSFGCDWGDANDTTQGWWSHKCGGTGNCCDHTAVIYCVQQ